MRFAKGHGTENDFVVLPDLDGSRDLTARTVAAICDRRAGLGADGVLRVVRAATGDADFVMDYRNADGSLAEMCGNGVRVLARWLMQEGLAGSSVRIATRGGVRLAEDAGGELIRVAMGPVDVREPDTVSVETETGRWTATPAWAPNPHAVAFVERLDAVGSLQVPPIVGEPALFPDGVNVEFVVERGDRHVALRVHERGSGETRSCGTGVCAVAAVAARRSGAGASRWTVDVPGGRLTVDLTDHDDAALTGPAVIVAHGELDPAWLQLAAAPDASVRP